MKFNNIFATVSVIILIVIIVLLVKHFNFGPEIHQYVVTRSDETEFQITASSYDLNPNGDLIFYINKYQKIGTKRHYTHYTDDEGFRHSDFNDYDEYDWVPRVKRILKQSEWIDVKEIIK